MEAYYFLCQAGAKNDVFEVEMRICCSWWVTLMRLEATVLKKSAFTEKGNERFPEHKKQWWVGSPNIALSRNVRKAQGMKINIAHSP